MLVVQSLKNNPMCLVNIACSNINIQPVLHSGIIETDFYTVKTKSFGLNDFYHQSSILKKKKFS